MRKDIYIYMCMFVCNRTVTGLDIPMVNSNKTFSLLGTQVYNLILNLENTWTKLQLTMIRKDIKTRQFFPF